MRRPDLEHHSDEELYPSSERKQSSPAPEEGTPIPLTTEQPQATPQGHDPESCHICREQARIYTEYRSAPKGD